MSKWTRSKAEKFIANPDAILTNTFLGEMKVQKQDIVDNMFKNFFVSLDPEIQNLFMPLYEKLDNPDFFGSQEDMTNYVNKYQNFILSYILHTTPYKNSKGKQETLNSLYSTLFKGTKTLPINLYKLKKSKDTSISDNLIIKELLPIISDDMKSTDNLKLFRSKLDTTEINSVVEALTDLKDYAENTANKELIKFVEDLAKFSIIQSGFDSGYLDFRKVLSIDVYSEFVKTILDNFKNSSNISFLNPAKVWKSFHQNNWYSKELVPLVPSYIKSYKLNTGTFKLGINTSAAVHDYLIKYQIKPGMAFKLDALAKEKRLGEAFTPMLFEKVGENANEDKVFYKRISLKGNKNKMLEIYNDNTDSIFEDNNSPYDEDELDSLFSDDDDLQEEEVDQEETTSLRIPVKDNTKLKDGDIVYDKNGTKFIFRGFRDKSKMGARSPRLEETDGSRNIVIPGENIQLFVSSKVETKPKNKTQTNSPLGLPEIKRTDVLQEYKGGFENTGKGTSQGDGKDKAMREIANSFIGEEDGLTLTSSTRTSAETIHKLESNDDVKNKASLKQSRVQGQVNTLNIDNYTNTNDSVVMLARNGSLKNKPLQRTTKESMTNAYNNGAEFVVGDMPGVDSQFIDYLQEIGAKFTIYHTGATSRIKVKETTQQSTSVKENSKKVFQKLVSTVPGSKANINKIIDTAFTNDKGFSVLPEVGIMIKPNALTSNQINYFLQLIKNSEDDAFYANVGKDANVMLVPEGKMWDQKQHYNIDGIYADKNPVESKNTKVEKNSAYSYYETDKDGNLLKPVSKETLDILSSLFGDNLHNIIDATIGNVYFKNTGIGLHKDTTEPDNNVGVYGVVLGNSYDLQVTTEETNNTKYGTGSGTEINLEMKQGTIYKFGLNDDKGNITGRFITHRPVGNVNTEIKLSGVKLPELNLPEVKKARYKQKSTVIPASTINEYGLSITYRSIIEKENIPQGQIKSDYVKQNIVDFTQPYTSDNGFKLPIDKKSKDQGPAEDNEDPFKCS